MYGGSRTRFENAIVNQYDIQADAVPQSLSSDRCYHFQKHPTRYRSLTRHLHPPSQDSSIHAGKGGKKGA